MLNRAPAKEFWNGSQGSTTEIDRIGFAGYCAMAFICLAPANSALMGIESGERYLWLVADAAAVLTILRHRDRVYECLFANPFLTLWPVIAIGSGAWSLTPDISIYHGLQLFMTILAGYALQIHFGLYRILKIVFWALLASQFLSVAAVFAFPRGAIGLGHEWLGIYPHKNVFGSMMALEMICAACLYMCGWHRTLTLGAFFGALCLLYLTKSATALVAAAFGFIPLVVMMIWMRGNHVIGFIGGILIAAGSILIGLIITNGDTMAAGFLDDLGKDRTMTGRTLLWQFAYDQFWREPWIGVGFKAYWESATTTAQYLRFSINQKLWFFHNNFFDVAVAFGIVGLITFGLGLLSSVRRAFIAVCAKPGYAEVFPLMFIFYTAVLMNFENVLFQNHSLHQFLLAAVTPLVIRRAASSRLRHDGSYLGLPDMYYDPKLIMKI